MKYVEIKEYARTLRRNSTPSERVLWESLRKRQLQGRKFLRQHPIIYERIKDEYFCFIPDFYCPSEKLAVEVDGGIHSCTEKKDQHRDQIINHMGIKIVRIKNEDLMNMNKVLQKISSQFLETK